MKQTVTGVERDAQGGHIVIVARCDKMAAQYDKTPRGHTATRVWRERQGTHCDIEQR